MRNLGNFATLFVGIGFASMLLLFSLAILPTMTHYAENLHNNVVAEHMYTLKAPLEVDNAQAEKYAVYSLEYDRGKGPGTESITVYGVPEDSRYWDDLAVGDGHVVFGNGLIDKFRFADGQTVNLYDKYEDETREVTYEGDGCAWGTKSDMAVYMSLDDFNRFFGNDAGYFNGYASDQALDLDARYLTSDLTPESMDAIGEQFVGMMDDMIGMLVGLSVFIFLVFMYLLTKSVIDRSARAISYMKVFGYRDSEISRLYVRSITLTVAVSLVVCQPLIIGGLTLLFRAMLLAYNGNIEIYVPMAAIAEVIAIGFATYLAVALLHIRRIKRVPLALALKVQE
ncbi:ABC transporter permease [Senegalimassilia anaerobia]|uniref:ABC transporter permease n=1 Tax=Senegalimassilia anaerobia TaxID=1473216 RepID=UPI003AB97ED3